MLLIVLRVLERVPPAPLSKPMRAEVLGEREPMIAREIHTAERGLEAAPPAAGGYLFFCSKLTVGECFSRSLFGCAGNDFATMQEIRQDTTLLLFNFSTRTLARARRSNPRALPPRCFPPGAARCSYTVRAVLGREQGGAADREGRVARRRDAPRAVRRRRRGHAVPRADPCVPRRAEPLLDPAGQRDAEAGAAEGGPAEDIRGAAGGWAQGGEGRRPDQAASPPIARRSGRRAAAGAAAAPRVRRPRRRPCRRR